MIQWWWILCILVLLFVCAYRYKETYTTPIRFVCSFTSSPTRIHATKPVIDALLSQSYPCEKIFVNLPYRFGRTGETYTIPSFLNHPKIHVNRFDVDDGPITKVSGTVRNIPRDEDTWIVYMDDDIRYPKTMLEHYAKYIRANPKQVYAPCGFTYHPEKVYDWGTYTRIGVPEGYGSVCAHRSFFGPTFLDYVDTVTKNKDCKLSDDMVMGWYFEKMGIPIRQVYESDFNDKYILKNCVLDYGNQADAIHNGASGTFQEQGHAEKYKRARSFLTRL